jgi:hypothetical protein
LPPEERDTMIVAAVWPDALAVNVALAAVVPAATAKLAATPVFQLDVVSVTVWLAGPISVLPDVRAIVTTVEAVGAALKRIVEAPDCPPGTVIEVGVADTERVGDPRIVNPTVATALSGVVALSYAVAVAVYEPAARPVAVAEYGDEVSVAISVVPTRNSTRATPVLSVAVAASATLVVPAGNCCAGVGELNATVGGVLPPPFTLNVMVWVALSDGLPLSYAVAVAVWAPADRPLALNVMPYGAVVSEVTAPLSMRNSTRATPLLSVAVADRDTAVPLTVEPFAGAVICTVGAVFPPGAVHATPFKVYAVGALLVPECVPLKATLNTPFVGMLAFQLALLATVTVELPAACVNETGQPFCTR